MIKNSALTMIGVLAGLMVVETTLRILGVSDFYELEGSIAECEYEKKLSLRCLPRYKPNQSWRIVRGGLMNNLRVEEKKTNDIGMMTDISSREVREAGKKTVILTVGDSYSESLYVRNDETFHGLLNGEKVNGRELVSIGIGVSGKALPTYLVYLKFALESMGRPSWIIIPIVTNDYDESFYKYVGRDGQYYFDEGGRVYGKPYERKWYSRLWAAVLRNSALSRHLFLDRAGYVHYETLKAVFGDGKAKSGNKKDTNMGQRTKDGNRGSLFFLDALEKMLGSEYTQRRVIFLVEGSRPKGESIARVNERDAERRYFLEEAKKRTLIALDMEQIYKKWFRREGIRFSGEMDDHWNEYAHSVIAKEVVAIMRKTSEQTVKGVGVR